MVIAVRFLSKLCHTKDIAESIVEELGVKAISILEEGALPSFVDILFLGGAPYANIMDDRLREYAKALGKDRVGKVILFTTSNWSRRTAFSLRKILENKGIEVGKSYFYAHMLRMEKGKKRAKSFAREAIR